MKAKNETISGLKDTIKILEIELEASKRVFNKMNQTCLVCEKRPLKDLNDALIAENERLEKEVENLQEGYPGIAHDFEQLKAENERLRKALAGKQVENE